MSVSLSSPRADVEVHIPDEQFATVLLDKRWRHLKFPHRRPPRWHDDIDTFRLKCLFSGFDGSDFEVAMAIMREAAYKSWPFIVRNSSELEFQMCSRLVNDVHAFWLIKRYVVALARRAKYPWLKPMHGCWSSAMNRQSLEVPLYFTIHCIVPNATGDRLVIGAANRVILLSLTTMLTLELLGHKSDVLSVAINTAGSRIVSGSADGEVRVWDVTTGTCLGDTSGEHDCAVTALAVSEDGRYAASASADSVCVWHVDTASLADYPVRMQHTHNIDDTHIRGIAMSATGRRVLFSVAAPTGVEQIMTFLVGDDSPPLPFFMDGRSQQSARSFLGRAADGRCILRVNCSTVKVVDLEEEGEECRETIVLNSVPSWFSRASLSYDGDAMAAWSPHDDIAVWQVHNDSSLTGGYRIGGTPTGRRFANAVAVSMNGKQVFTGSADGVLRLWEVEHGRNVSVTETGEDEVVTAIGVSPQNGNVVGVTRGGRMSLWEFESGELVAGVDTDLQGLITWVSFTAHGECVAVGTTRGDVGVWKIGHDSISVITGVGEGCGIDSLKAVGRNLLYVTAGDRAFMWDFSGEAGVELVEDWTRGSSEHRRWADCLGVFHSNGVDRRGPIICRGRRVFLEPERRLLATLPAEVNGAAAWCYDKVQNLFVAGLSDGSIVRCKVEL